MFLRTKRAKGHAYVQLVENRWEQGRSRQRVLVTLGRLDRLQASGELDALIQSAARFHEELLVLGAHRGGDAPTLSTQRIGAVRVFERLWRESGCLALVDGMLEERKFEFAVERAIFLEVLHRLLAPGSDRDGYDWRADYEIAGAEELHLHHAYRAMSWLGEELPENRQEGRTPFAPRTVKDEIEEQLFGRRRDLFSNLEIVFFDTTSIYFEGEGGESIGRRGHSKDHRPDLLQMIVGVVVDDRGHPICCEMWPGNTADVTTLLPIAERLKQRFGVERVCVVADRGMIKKATIEELEKRQWPYILGARMRSQKEVSDDVLARGGRYRVVHGPRATAHDPSPLEVKEVKVAGRRYIVCRNAEQAKKDAADRQAILEALERRLPQGAKSFVGNEGFRRFLKAEGTRFAIDTEKVEREERNDGKWVLRTNTNWDAAEVALRYKQLWLVEDIFRTLKSVLETRPIFHKTDAAIRGHVFCSFLAFLLRKELQDRLHAANLDGVEWRQLVRDLDRLEHVVVEHQGKRFQLRTAPQGVTGRVFQAVGLTLPPAVTRLPKPTPQPVAHGANVS